MAKDNKRSSTETARRIWLAGIGAYGRAFTEAQETLKEVTGKGSEVFDELVQKGQMIETVGKAKGKEMFEKAKVADFDMPEFDLDDRIKAMRDRLSRVGKEEIPQAASYEDRLAAVEAKLDRILELLEPKPVRKKATKKAPVKKATTQRTKKPTAKKAPAKKPAAKK